MEALLASSSDLHPEALGKSRLLIGEQASRSKSDAKYTSTSVRSAEADREVGGRGWALTS